MNVLRKWPLLGAMLVTSLLSSAVRADLAVPGDFQGEIGAGGDWSLADAPLMNDLGGGLWDLPLAGLDPNAAGLAANTRYNFKIVNAEPTPIAWGNGEVPNNGPGSSNSWLQADAGGDATIMLDRNVYADGFLPATDRIVISTDSTEFSSFFATGDWLDEAGGAGDFVANDPVGQMSDLGGGLWSVDVVVSTPGSYLYKATAGDFAFQWGTNGRLDDSANLAFDTVNPNQPVTFLLDISKGAISLATIPEPATGLLLGLGGLAALAVRRRR